MLDVFDLRRSEPGAILRGLACRKRGKIAPGGLPEALSFSVVLQGALHELRVAFGVQQAVAAVVERNGGRFVPGLRFERAANGPPYGLAVLRRRNWAPRVGRDSPRLE